MPFDPTCLPPLPTCADDMTAWAEQMVTCLTQNFNTAFNNIAAVAVPPFNMCQEIGSLGEGCYLTPEGIDQTRFSYAETPADVLPGNGVLPTPPTPETIDYRAGAVTGNNATGNWNSQTCNDPGGGTIPLVPPMTAGGYSVFLTLGNDVGSRVYAYAPNESRGANSFQIRVVPRSCDPEDENVGVWLYWMAIRING